MNQDWAIELLQRQIREIEDLTRENLNGWFSHTVSILEKIFGRESRHVGAFSQTPKIKMGSINKTVGVRTTAVIYKAGLNSLLSGFIKEIEDFGIPEQNSEKTAQKDASTIIENICNHFHAVARQLHGRHDNRPTLDINDEYDVQDLLHALLRLYFNDIRSEEWTPSYAGKSARMDFLLKEDQIVIEVKKSRNGLGAKKVGDELIIDIERYQVHSDCKTLICFVYDPEGKIANPAGLESDLSRESEAFTVRVFIYPKA